MTLNDRALDLLSINSVALDDAERTDARSMYGIDIDAVPASLRRSIRARLVDNCASRYYALMIKLVAPTGCLTNPDLRAALVRGVA